MPCLSRFIGLSAGDAFFVDVAFDVSPLVSLSLSLVFSFFFDGPSLAGGKDRFLGAILRE